MFSYVLVETLVFLHSAKGRTGPMHLLIPIEPPAASIDSLVKRWHGSELNHHNGVWMTSLGRWRTLNREALLSLVHAVGSMARPGAAAGSFLQSRSPKQLPTCRWAPSDPERHACQV